MAENEPSEEEGRVVVDHREAPQGSMLAREKEKTGLGKACGPGDLSIAGPA